MYIPTYSEFLFLFDKFDIFFCDQKIFNCEMLIKYCAILFMSVSISVSGETKICLSFPMCNDHLNESMRKPNGKEGSDIKFRKSMKLFRWY